MISHALTLGLCLVGFALVGALTLLLGQVVSQVCRLLAAGVGLLTSIDWLSIYRGDGLFAEVSLRILEHFLLGVNPLLRLVLPGWSGVRVHVGFAVLVVVEVQINVFLFSL